MSDARLSKMCMESSGMRLFDKTVHSVPKAEPAVVQYIQSMDNWIHHYEEQLHKLKNRIDELKLAREHALEKLPDAEICPRSRL